MTTITAPAAWTDTQHATCAADATCTDQRCPLTHTGEEPAARYALCEANGTRVELWTTIDDAMVEMVESHTNQPFAKGEAFVRDLVAGAQVDALGFVREFC